MPGAKDIVEDIGVGHLDNVTTDLLQEDLESFGFSEGASKYLSGFAVDKSTDFLESHGISPGFSNAMVGFVFWGGHICRVCLDKPAEAIQNATYNFMESTFGSSS